MAYGQSGWLGIELRWSAPAESQSSSGKLERESLWISSAVVGGQKRIRSPARRCVTVKRLWMLVCGSRELKVSADFSDFGDLLQAVRADLDPRFVGGFLRADTAGRCTSSGIPVVRKKQCSLSGLLHQAVFVIVVLANQIWLIQ